MKIKLEKIIFSKTVLNIPSSEQTEYKERQFGLCLFNQIFGDIVKPQKEKL